MLSLQTDFRRECEWALGRLREIRSPGKGRSSEAYDISTLHSRAEPSLRPSLRADLILGEPERPTTRRILRSENGTNRAPALALPQSGMVHPCFPTTTNRAESQDFLLPRVLSILEKALGASLCTAVGHGQDGISQRYSLSIEGYQHPFGNRSC